MNIIDAIRKANYVANERDVEQLAAAHMDAQRTQGATDGSYLRVLIASCQAVLGTAKRRTANMPEAHSKVLADTHNRFYPHVIRGVTTTECEEFPGLPAEEERLRRLERLRRATFARSAKSTLDSYIKVGGDVRTLDPSTASKGLLRKYVQDSDPPQVVEAMEAYGERIIRVAKRMAEENPQEARNKLEDIVARIQEVIDSLEEPKHTESVAGTSTVIRRAVREAARPGTMMHKGVNQ